MAVGGPASPIQPQVQGNHSGGGGQVHVITPKATVLKAVGGPTLLGHLPTEGTGGGGGKVHTVPIWMTLMATAGRPTPPLGHRPAEGRGGGGGKIHAIVSQKGDREVREIDH